MKHLYATILVSLSLLPFTGQSQVPLTTINLNNVPSTGGPTAGNEPYFQWNGTSLILDTRLIRGAGVTVGPTLTGGFVGSGFTDHSLAGALANDRYFEFSSGAASNGRLSIQALDCYLYRSSTGPVWYQWETSTDGFATPGVPLGDSVLFTGFDSAGIKQPAIVTRYMSSFLYLSGAMTFRLYVWGSNDPDGVFGFGRPASDNSITTMGRWAQRFQDFTVGPTWGVPGFFTTKGKPSPWQTMWIYFSDITDTITLTMPANFEISRDSTHWTRLLKIDPYTDTTATPLYVRATASAPPGDISGNIVLTTPGLPTEGSPGTYHPSPLYGTVYPAAYRILYATTFRNCDPYTPGPPTDGFTAYNVSGDASIWACSLYGRDPAQLSGARPAHGPGIGINPGGNGYPPPTVYIPDEDWLISPRFDLSATHYPLLNFWSRAGLYTYWPLQLKVSTDYSGSGDPRTAHWTNINGHFPPVLSDIWTQSSGIDLSDYKQNAVYIALVFNSPGAGGTGWSIDDFILFDTPSPLPMLTTSSGSLDFGYAAAGNAVGKKLTLTTDHLAGDITISTAGNDFLVSADSVNFSTTATIGHDTANNTTEPVYVRFAPSSNNVTYTDSLSISVPDTTIMISLKGNSLPPASTMSIVSWNLGYFGTAEPGAGPIDKTLQVATVNTLLPSLHADIYALQEVVNEAALASIVSNMPGYAYSISTYGAHSNPSDPAPATPDTVQRLAFVYNTAKVKDVQIDSLLTTGTRLSPDVTTRYYSDWAGGRYPYMLTANVTLDDRSGGTTVKKIRFINIHAKADTGDRLAAYSSRWRASFALDSLIQANYKSDNVVVLGDFNDDLNHTITTGMDTTSYMPFIRDSLLYQYPTQALSQQHEYTDANTSGVLENMILNSTMAASYLPSSATVLSEVASGNPAFATTVTPHYPVLSQLSFTPPVTPLPVTLLNFTAVKQDATAKLAWTTTNESNSAQFDLQRSGDSQTFTTIGPVAAKGNSSTPANYSFIDPSPLTGNNYYRLKQVDKDAKFTYSKTVLLDFSSLTLRLIPNPAHGTVNLFVGNTNEAFSIRIIDLNGRIVQQIQTTPGTANIPIDISRLATGVYSVKVTSATTTTTQKLVVQ